MYITNVKLRRAETNVASISGNINNVVSSRCETTVETISCILSSVDQYTLPEGYNVRLVQAMNLNSRFLIG